MKKRTVERRVLKMYCVDYGESFSIIVNIGFGTLEKGLAKFARPQCKNQPDLIRARELDFSSAEVDGNIFSHCSSDGIPAAAEERAYGSSARFAQSRGASRFAGTWVGLVAEFIEVFTRNRS